MRTRIPTGWLVLMGVASGLTVASCGVTPGSRAQAPECQAWNATAGGAASADLQAVIDAAAARDTIRVAGTCTGGFTVTKDLTLSRDPDQSRPTLDGAGKATVLTVVGSHEAPVTVLLRGLRITHGSAVRGGGLRNRFGQVRLVDSVVTGNRASLKGAGIHSRGWLTVSDTRVAANATPGPGGGIFSRGRLTLTGGTTVGLNRHGGIAVIGSVALLGHASVVRNAGSGVSSAELAGLKRQELRCRVTMDGSSSVRGNTGGWYGGIGICSVVMNDRSSVRRNRGAGIAGGVTMNDWAVVSGNTSRQNAGGVYGRVVMNDHARIVRNTAGWRGGGIYGGPVRLDGPTYEGPPRLNGHSVVAFNTAREGGGIYVWWSDVFLRDQAAIRRNLAKDAGGGVLSWTGCPQVLGRVVVRDRATIRQNVPDNITYRIDGCDVEYPPPLSATSS